MLELFKALADETRLRILAQLLRGEMCVCEIETALGLSQSNASRHLAILRRAGILECCKVAQWTHYRVSKRFVEENGELYRYLQAECTGLSCFEQDGAWHRKCKRRARRNGDKTEAAG